MNAVVDAHRSAGSFFEAGGGFAAFDWMRVVGRL